MNAAQYCIVCESRFEDGELVIYSKKGELVHHSPFTGLILCSDEYVKKNPSTGLKSRFGIYYEGRAYRWEERVGEIIVRITYEKRVKMVNLDELVSEIEKEYD